jgi:hypothetical protein
VRSRWRSLPDVSWYWWVLLWAVLLLLAAGVFARIGLTLWRKASALAKELAAAAEQLARAGEGLAELAETRSDPAVFTAASQLRQERYLNERRRDGKRSAAKGAEPAPRSSRTTGQRVR